MRITSDREDRRRKQLVNTVDSVEGPPRTAPDNKSMILVFSSRILLTLYPSGILGSAWTHFPLKASSDLSRTSVFVASGHEIRTAVVASRRSAARGHLATPALDVEVWVGRWMGPCDMVQRWAIAGQLRIELIMSSVIAHPLDFPFPVNW